MEGPAPTTYERRRKACVALRLQLAISQAKLAKALGTSRERVSRFENSHVTLPKRELAQLERVLAELREEHLEQLRVSEVAC